MEDPYKKLYEDLSKALTKLADMIVWVAKRTLSVSEFEQLVKEFEEEREKRPIDDLIREINRRRECEHEETDL